MKTREMFASLRAFARLAGPAQAEALCRFAELFREGKDETVATRLKRASAPSTYPVGLNDTLSAISGALSERGAKKQATDLRALSSLFTGKPGSTVQQFVDEIRSSLENSANKQRKKKEVAPDHKLARELADELTRYSTDPERFSQIVEKLKDQKAVPTPTLALIAHY